MLEVYFAVTIICAGFWVLFVIITGLLHLEYKDSESAGDFKMVLLCGIGILIWPLIMVVAPFVIIYLLFKAGISAFRDF